MDMSQLLTIIITFIVFSGGAILTILIYLGNKIDGIKIAISTESKDFHGRLVALEERYQQIVIPKKEIIKK